MDEIRQAMEVLRVKHDELVVEMASANEEKVASAQDIQVKDTLINQLKEQLFDVQRKIDERETSVAAKTDAPAEIESRLKVLEVSFSFGYLLKCVMVELTHLLLTPQENLNQMNAYADHLELVIGQCPSCSVKVQAESTQDIENRA
uniref:Uncharacterized protein n=1 Tax=Globisporangium ultimum (strain ATCC 200006 / CBS 805.95 / DAOM BR144) TaxID=431595 RepID=K3WZB8_GLOUD